MADHLMCAAPPNGRDDTATIEDASATGKPLQRGTYKYRGAGINTSRSVLTGQGPHVTSIEILPGAHVFDADQPWSDLHVEGIQFYGGQGAIRNRHTGGNVTNLFTVRNCKFAMYTGAAISHNATDMPYWQIEDNVFWAANSTTAIGVALPGLTDGNNIVNNKFLLNKVHVKLGDGGNNAYLENNDFIQFGAGTHRASVWVVPKPIMNNSGAGFVLERCKFGNENQDATDFRVLYADDTPGGYFGDRLPNLDADSTGFITGHSIGHSLINGAGSVNQPFVYSTTPNVLSSHYGDLVLNGALPSHIVGFRTPPTSSNPDVQSNVIGPIRAVGTDFTMSHTNAVGLFHVVDPAQAFTPAEGVPLSLMGAGRGTGFVNLLPHGVRSFVGAGAKVTHTPITDSIGGRDATEVALGPTGGTTLNSYLTPGALRAGVPVWVEFDVMAAQTDTITAVQVLFQRDTAGAGGANNPMRRRVPVTPEWVTHRFLTYAQVANDRHILRFVRVPGGSGGAVRLGRVRVYHASEPQPFEVLLPGATDPASAPGVLFVEGGALMYRGPSGTVTTIASP